MCWRDCPCRADAPARPWQSATEDVCLISFPTLIRPLPVRRGGSPFSEEGCSGFATPYTVYSCGSCVFPCSPATCRLALHAPEAVRRGAGLPHRSKRRTGAGGDAR